MFKWAASVSTKFASSLSETFAPLFRTPLDQLHDAWKKVETDCQALMLDSNSETMDDPQRLVDSQLVQHLNQLVEALVKEEDDQVARTDVDEDETTGSHHHPFENGKESGKSSTGPCFEYFLNEKILDRLCALGLPDRPLGMRQLITKTLDAVLLNTKHPILPSMSVHMAVRQFLEVCYTKEDYKRRGYRSAFLSLLCTISKKIKADNSLAGIFFDIFPAKENRKPEFLLFTALCAMMSESAVEGRNAYEALLWIVQLPNPSITEYIITYSPYLTKTVDSLIHLFKALPPPVECPLIDELLQAQQSYPSLDNFFKRWSYCDIIMKSTYDSVQIELGLLIRTKFLDGVIAPLLLDNRESVAMWTTNFLKHLALSTEAPILRRVLIEFLLGSDTEPELPPTEDGTIAAVTDSTPSTSTTSSSSTSSSSIRSILLKRLDSLSDSLCIHTLDLFQTLIGLREPLVIQNLILRNLQPPHSAHTTSSSSSSLSSTATIDCTTPISTTSHANDILPIQQAVMFANFTDLPDFATLPNFEDYLLDGQLEGQLWMQAYEDEFQRQLDERQQADEKAVESSLNAPSKTTTPQPDAIETTDVNHSSTTTATVAPVTTPFYEGLFLSTLCNKLETLYENSFATNLKLSSVLSKLSYCPSPILHDFLFNPDYKLPSSTTGRSHESDSEPRLILHVLASVWNKGIKRASRMQNFARRKEEARQRLNQQISPSIMATQTSVETMDGERFFRGLILLEEFLKEFYAIAHTKARLFALQKLARLQAAATHTNTSTTTPLSSTKSIQITDVSVASSTSTTLSPSHDRTVSLTPLTTEDALP